MKTIKTIKQYNMENNLVEHPMWTEEDFKLDINDTFPVQTALAYKLNNNLENGFYVEVGTGHYKELNHSYYLEKKYGWKGVSLDNSQKVVDDFNSNRSNPCIYGDALTFNWKSYFEENNFPKEIDYLSIDVDFFSHNWANLLAFLNLPINEYRFNVISIEHLASFRYEFEKVKMIQREILTALGYFLIIRGPCDDIWYKEVPNSNNGLTFLSTWEMNNL